MAPAGEAVKAGDAVQATKLLFDWVANQGAGAFDKQPEAVRQMILDNARTVPLLLAAACAASGLLRHPWRCEGPHPGHRRGTDAAIFFSDQ